MSKIIFQIHFLFHFIKVFLPDSVLGSLLLILYTTSYVKHHHYANDTQLFISFSALDFSLNIAHLKTTIDNASTWISANLFSVDQFKTKLNSLTYLSHSQIIFHPCRTRVFYPFVTFFESAKLLTIPLLKPELASHLFQGRLL